MKIVKPTVVSLSARTFLVLQRQQLCVTSLVGFGLGDGVRRLVPEIVLWPAIGEVTAGIVDEGLPKPCGEALVYGSCYAPGGLPVTMTTVRLCITRSPGASRRGIDKKLAVFGDRFWQGTAVRGSTADPIPLSRQASAPAPFSKMPLGWDRAFGGELSAKNPLGKGMTRVAVEGDIERLPLPNLELPSKLMTSSADRPDPAGFGPVDVSWQQRQAKAGSYGGKWLEEDFPGYARDTDVTFFSTAAEDQQIQGYFHGDEEYILENVHPTCSVLRGRLPGVGARALVRRQGNEHAEEVKMRLDTVVFLPDKEIGILVFRGLTPVFEDDAADIAIAFAACEDLDAPRPTEHYVASLERRLNKDESPLAALNETDLLPSFARAAGIAELLGKLEDPTKVFRDRIRDRTLARVRQQLVDEGVEDPDAVLAQATQRSPLEARLERLPDPADPDDLAEYMAALEALGAYGDEQRDAAILGVRQQLDDAERTITEEIGDERVRGDALAKIDAARRALAGEPPSEDAPPNGDGPPAPQLPGMLAMYREAGLEPEPNILEKLRQVDVVALDSYRASAHYMPPARYLDAAAREGGRRAVIELRAANESLAELDWTRYDLSGLDLSQGDLRKTLLEGADLTKTKLAGANLAGAVLAHSTLRETSFDGATLEGTNLGAARVDGATFAGANLNKAVLVRTKLLKASFEGADLTEAEWLEAEFGAVKFDGARADGMSFVPRMGAPEEPPPPTDLTKCRFVRSRLKKADLLWVNLDGVDLSEADLELATFLSATARGANFRGASLRRVHAVMECSFEGACFDGADLTDAFLRGANLRGATFEGTRLDGADLSECDLSGAKLTRAQAKGVLLVRADLKDASLRGANLMEGMLQKSKLHGADLSNTNLFGANLGQVRLDQATQLRGANLKRALTLPKARA